MHQTMNLPVTARGHLSSLESFDIDAKIYSLGELDPMKEKNKTLKCPKCGSSNIMPEAGFVTGYKYNCKDCSYVGSLIIEEDIEDSRD